MAARFLHIVLALITLLSSTGVVLNKHYCQGNLKNATFFVQPHSCHTADRMPACSHHQSESEDNGCCSNHADYLKQKIDLQQVGFDTQVPVPPQVVLPSAIDGFNLLAPTTQLLPAFLTFKPPIVRAEIWLRLENLRC